MKGLLCIIKLDDKGFDLNNVSTDKFWRIKCTNCISVQGVRLFEKFDLCADVTLSVWSHTTEGYRI